MKFSGLCLAGLLTILPLTSFAGSLNVGTKVIYPGGADQPPKEKDTGVSLKTDVVGIAEEQSSNQLDSYRKMLEEGNYQELLENLEGNDSPEYQTLKALALYYCDEEQAAFELAEKLLKNPILSQESKQKLCDEMSIEMPEQKEIEEEEEEEKNR